MAEAAGLAVGVVALLGLFNNAVESFEYIQLGRNFGRDFQTNQLKLDNARLRLTRWGQSCGLANSSLNTSSLEENLGLAKIEDAHGLLLQILDLLGDAQDKSSKYRNRKKSGDSSLLVMDPQTALDPTGTKLHKGMQQLSLDRRTKPGTLQKMKWALYEQKECKRLTEDIVELTNNLIELFPATKVIQRELCEEEVRAIGSSEELPALRAIAQEQDSLLVEIIDRAMNKATTSYSTVFSGANNQGLQIGHNSGSVSGVVFGRNGQAPSSS